jgi:hypothetical protein
MNNQMYNTNDLISDLKEKILETPLFTKLIFWLSTILFILGFFWDFNGSLCNCAKYSFYSF